MASLRDLQAASGPQAGGRGLTLADMGSPDEMNPDPSEQEFEANLQSVMEMALSAGFDAQSAVDRGDWDGLIGAAMKAIEGGGQQGYPAYGGDGDYSAIDALSSQLGIPSPFGEYSEQDQYRDEPPPPVSPAIPQGAARRHAPRGGIGSR